MFDSTDSTMGVGTHKFRSLSGSQSSWCRATTSMAGTELWSVSHPLQANSRCQDGALTVSGKARQGQRMLFSSLNSTSRAISKLNRYYLKNITCRGAFHRPLLTRKNVDWRKGFPQAPRKGRKGVYCYLTGSCSSTQESWCWRIQTE